MCVGCWLINSEVKHHARSAQRQNKELMPRSDNWDTMGWDEKVDGIGNKDEYHWLNGNDSRKPKQSNRNLHHCHFVHQRSHMERPGKELEPL